jgi:hypothetical protein
MSYSIMYPAGATTGAAISTTSGGDVVYAKTNGDERVAIAKVWFKNRKPNTQTIQLFDGTTAATAYTALTPVITMPYINDADFKQDEISYEFNPPVMIQNIGIYATSAEASGAYCHVQLVFG